MPFLPVDILEDCSETMNVRDCFYRHPFAAIITGVFLYALLITLVYFFGLLPGVRKTQQGLTSLLVITLVLFATTVATWITAIILSSESV